MSKFSTKPSGPVTKKTKKVVISEIEQLASKPSISSQLPAVPLKSALKKKGVPQKTNSKKLEEAEESEEEPARSPTGEEDVLQLNGLGEEDSDDDSSDEDDDSSEDESNQSSDDESNAHPSSTDQSTPNRKSDRKSAQEQTGVVYLGRIPQGFYENEMRAYFTQFGEVLRLRLSRCKRTGKPKHYAFIEFKHVEVAQIVAETIHNYLLCGKLLQCQLLDKDQIHPKLWVGTGKKFMKDCKLRLDREKRNQVKTLPQQTVISNRLIEREELKRKRLADLGIDYDFPGYKPQAETNPTPDENRKKNKKSKKKV
ncbi:hypothetical protein PTTG_07308 [Puccinia triticina 1-1 BBBD Race 1]|uniref:RRM domain-containing protein n=2 Tax=Puccinia triticina TaxID=208348 RepID=A0A180GZD2_PUCT1|nr:uncharacterized protein PtA15_15A377 [Puccinia triticina]OAV97861.1 hypothetical protein PTTG_07308 [Puccinia triticina 1-1 BBBD Race 1]WAQ91984.1 hypothetical protein PtA15_15A377 [Puccinia triticina]WAR62789.1 hypothetical protein PtB15_15B377 [Puccinia triticina]